LKDLKIYGVVLAVLLLLFGGVVLHGWMGNGSSIRQLRAARSFLPSGDPGMNTSARYVRHLALTYPGSPFPDFPGQPDYLPAGMAWAPHHFPGVRTRIEPPPPEIRKKP